MNTNNIKEGLTKILKNKNTFTILIVFAGIIGLYVVYNWRVKEATQLVSVPYAKKELNSRDEIKDDSISYMQVPKSVLSSANNILTSTNSIRGKFVNYGYTIPQYGFFYKEAILSNSAKPESEFSDLESGYTIFQLEVDFDSTYGNSIYPGNYIDLYVKLKEDDTDRIIFGRLIKGIKVRNIFDGNGDDVFESSSEARKPKYMWFAVQNELFELLKVAQEIKATIIPIPRNASYSDEERTPEIDSKYLQTYITARKYNFNNKVG